MIFLKMVMFEVVSKYLWSGMNVCMSMEPAFSAGAQGVTRDNGFLEAE